MPTTVKDEVLAALESSRGAHISGEELAEKLGVSRNAVWKAVQTLAAEGYRIQAVRNRGYCLSSDTDIPSEHSVRRYLGEGSMFRFEFRKTVDSTNNELKRLAAAGEAEGLVLVAEEQNAGKGRMGRAFHSPAGTGVYMSLLLRPKLKATESLLITLAAAVATATSIEAISGRAAKIKWVNDIVMGGKKVCGILTEAALDLESGGLEYAVLGIGINVKEPEGGFPQQIADIAGAVFATGGTPAVFATGGTPAPGGTPATGGAPEDARSRMIAGVLTRFEGYYRELGTRAYMTAYRERSTLVGKEIVILGRNVRATALGVDDDGRLLVRLASGQTEALSSGEVSVRATGAEPRGKGDIA